MKPGDWVNTTREVHGTNGRVIESGSRCMVVGVTDEYVKMLPPVGAEIIYLTDRTAIEKVPQFAGPVGYQTETNCAD